MSLNQTVRGLIDRLPTLTTEERWVVQVVLDIAEKRSLGMAAEYPAPPPHVLEPIVGMGYERLTVAPYFVTPRELQVLDLLLSGLSNKEVAGKLGISFKTVQSHRQRVMDKLGARSPMHLAEMVRRINAS